MEENILNFTYKQGVRTIHPGHQMVKNWAFDDSTEKEAVLANAMAHVAEKSGMTANDLQHIFPAVLRMLKNDTAWAK